MVDRVDKINCERSKKMESNNNATQRTYTYSDLRPVIDAKLSEMGIKGQNAEGLKEIAMKYFFIVNGMKPDQSNKA